MKRKEVKKKKIEQSCNSRNLVTPDNSHRLMKESSIPVTERKKIIKIQFTKQEY